MGTKAIYGFQQNGIRKMSYTQFEGYPESLGEDVVAFVRSLSVHELQRMFKELILVYPSEEPTIAQINVCSAFLKLENMPMLRPNWYALLCPLQGTLTPYKEGFRYFLVCDTDHYYYEFLINLDTYTFDVYYFNRLMGSFPLENIPQNWVDVTNENYDKEGESS